MRTLLITDDHDSVLRTLEYVFTSHGYRVLLADSGSAAVEIGRNEVIDLALVDLHMPGMDGFQTCSALMTQAREQERSLPVWLMTAAFSSGAKARALESGAVTLLGKPFDCAEFISAVERYFTMPAMQPSSSPASLPVDRPEGLANVAGGTAINL